MKKIKKLETASVWNLMQEYCAPRPAVKKDLQGDEAEGLGGQQQVVVAPRPVGCRKRDDDNPEVREDEIEQEHVAREDGEEEGHGVECGRQDRLLRIRCMSRPLTTIKAEGEGCTKHDLTYNHELVDDVVTAPALRDEVGQNAHDHDGRDPYQRSAGKREEGEPGAGTILTADHCNYVCRWGSLVPNLFSVWN